MDVDHRTGSRGARRGDDAPARLCGPGRPDGRACPVVALLGLGVRTAGRCACLASGRARRPPGSTGCDRSGGERADRRRLPSVHHDSTDRPGRVRAVHRPHHRHDERRLVPVHRSHAGSLHAAEGTTERCSPRSRSPPSHRIIPDWCWLPVRSSARGGSRRRPARSWYRTALPARVATSGRGAIRRRPPRPTSRDTGQRRHDHPCG